MGIRWLVRTKMCDLLGCEFEIASRGRAYIDNGAPRNSTGKWTSLSAYNGFFEGFWGLTGGHRGHNTTTTVTKLAFSPYNHVLAGDPGLERKMLQGAGDLERMGERNPQVMLLAGYWLAELMPWL